MNYIPSQQLRASVEAGNPAEIRQAIQVELNNATLKDEDATLAFEWAAERVPAILDDHLAEQEPIEEDTANWTADYFFDQKVAINNNFSRTRYLHLVAVRNHLRATGHPDFVRIGPKPKVPKNSSPRQRAETRPNGGSYRYGRPKLTPAKKADCVIAGLLTVASGIILATAAHIIKIVTGRRR